LFDRLAKIIGVDTKPEPFSHTLSEFSAQARSVIDSHPTALFAEADVPGSAIDALALGDSYVPSVDGALVYFRVDDVDATLDRTVERGAEVLDPVTDVGEQDVVAEFADGEGNRIALLGAE